MALDKQSNQKMCPAKRRTSNIIPYHCESGRLCTFNNQVYSMYDPFNICVYSFQYLVYRFTAIVNFKILGVTFLEFIPCTYLRKPLLTGHVTCIDSSG